MQPGPGTIALIGGEEFEPGFQEVHRSLLAELGRPRPKVVFFPTAAAADGPGVASEWGRQCERCLGALGAQVEVALVEDRAGAESPTIVRTVGEADLVYLGGGKPGYLLDVLGSSPTWAAIAAAYRRGAMLVGASAGAMVLAEYMLYIRSDADFPPRRWAQGLDLIHGAAVAPHLNRFSAPRLADIRRSLDSRITLIGIEEFTALVLANDAWEVRGSGGVRLQGPNGERWYRGGQRLEAPAGPTLRLP